VSCAQFRCRDLTDSKVNLYTPNDPIIESSHGLTIGPFNWKYPLLRKHSELAEVIGDFKDDSGTMVTKTNKWNLIFDFTKKEDGTLNYELQSPEDFKVLTHRDVLQPGTEVQETGDDFLYELPEEFGGSLTQQEKPKDSLMAFDITTGAASAEEQFRKQEEAKEEHDGVTVGEPEL